MPDLHELLATRADTPPHAIFSALREGLAADPAASGAAAGLHALLQGYFAIESVVHNGSHAGAFRQHPEAARGLLAVLEEDGETRVAALMRSLIDGAPQPTGALRQGLEGAGADEAQRHGPGIAAALQAFAAVALESDASAAELELSLGWSAVEEGLLDRVERQADVLAFRHGASHHAALGREQQLDALAASSSITTMIGAFAAASTPCIIARAPEWDIANAGAPADSVGIPVAHRMGRPASGAAAALASDATTQVRELYACANGAELFFPVSHEPAQAGLTIIPDTDWEEEREHIMTWVTMGMDDDDKLPDWVAGVIPFAMLPGDASRWVVPAEGPFAGAVLLSNDDLPDGPPRYRSVAHFCAALRLMPQEILGCGGYVSYLVPGSDQLRYPKRYLESPEDPATTA